MQPIYDPFSVNDDDDDDTKTTPEDQSIASDAPVINYQTPTTPKEDESAPAASFQETEQTPRTPQDAPEVVDERTVPLSPETEFHGNDSPMAHANIRSSSEDSTEGEGLQSTAENIEPTPSGDDDGTAIEYARQLDVSLAVNEDLTCEYHRSKLSSLSVEGTVQIRVQTRHKQDLPPQQQQQRLSSIPFFLVVQDRSGHIKTIQENNKFAENTTQEVYDSPGDVKYTIQVPEAEEYAPVLRYKCDSSLRPVPIVSTTFVLILPCFKFATLTSVLCSPTINDSEFKVVFVPKANSAALPSK